MRPRITQLLGFSDDETLSRIPRIVDCNHKVITAHRKWEYLDLAKRHRFLQDSRSFVPGSSAIFRPDLKNPHDFYLIASASRALQTRLQ